MKKLDLTVEARDGPSRYSTMELPHGRVETPCFVPVGTYMATNGLNSRYVENEPKIPLMLVNTYHLANHSTREVLGETFDVLLPATGTRIGKEEVFENKYLRSIIIPASVEVIRGKAFYNNSDIVTIKFEDGSRLKNVCNETFRGCSALRSIFLPSSVTRIGEGAFLNTKNLLSIVIPASVEEIGGRAFRGSSIETIEFEEASRLKKIGEEAFYDCSALQSIVLPSTVTHIGESAFRNTKNLRSMVIPATVEEIGNGLFCESSIETVKFEDGACLKKISEYAFFWCFALQSIVLPSTITHIGTAAFRNTNNLRSMVIPATVEEIGNYCFCQSSIEKVEFEDGACLKKISDYAFYHCVALRSIELPATVTYIGRNAVAEKAFRKFPTHSAKKRKVVEGQEVGNLAADGPVEA